MHFKILNDISKTEKIFIVTGYAGMRKFIDGLARVVQQNFRLNLFQSSLFLFCGRKRDHMKALYWEGDGFTLLYKCLESGSLQ